MSTIPVQKGPPVPSLPSIPVTSDNCKENYLTEFWDLQLKGGEMTPVSAISPPSTRSEDTFLSGDCQLYFSTGSLEVVNCFLETSPPDLLLYRKQSMSGLEYLSFGQRNTESS
jgi:hypothetical protein